MASRRRRQKSIGSVVNDVKRRVTNIEKRPGATRLKRNVVTGEKIQYRTVPTKAIQSDAITANEAAFGTTFVTATQPTEYLKEGTTWIDPNTGAAAVYDPVIDDFIDITAIDETARTTSNGKNTIYAQTTAPLATGLKINDIWYDTDDGNKLYVWSGTTWVNIQDTAIAAAASAASAAQSTADGKNKIYRQASQPTGGTYVAGDIWFDDDDDNKMYRYSGSAWVAVQLGGNALANINANSITSGTIDANTITVSNLNAGNISTGTLAAARIAANSLDVSVLQAGTLRTGTIYTGDIVASQITSGTITGRTLRTSASGRRVEIDASNNALSFYNSSGTALGHIRPATDYAGVIISSGGSATSDFASSAYPKMIMYPAGSDGQFTLILDSANGGLSFSSSSGVYSLTIGATNTAAVNPYGQRSLREIGFGSATTYPDLSSITSGITGQEGLIVLTYS